MSTKTQKTQRTKKTKSATKPYERLVNYVVNNAHRGDVITHRELVNIMLVPYGTHAYRYAISKANKIVTTHNKRLCSVPTVGYRVLLNEDYAYDAAKNLRIAGVYANKSAFILDNCDKTQLVSKKNHDTYNEVATATTNINGVLVSCRKQFESVIPSWK